MIQEGWTGETVAGRRGVGGGRRVGDGRRGWKMGTVDGRWGEEIGK